jgi:hypothetical protein
LSTAFADAYRTSAALLANAVDHLTEGGVAPDPEEAAAAGRRLDDALRQYLAEQGGKRVALESVSALASGAERLRFAGLSVNAMGGARPTGTRPSAELQPVADVLDRRAHQVTSWYATLADAFAAGRQALPEPALRPNGDSFVQVVLPVLDRSGDEARAEQVERMLWTAQYVGDIDRLRTDLLGPAAQVVDARTVPWWHL